MLNKRLKLYVGDVLFEILKEDNPNTLIWFMKELCKVSNLKQYRKNRTDKNTPVIISKKQYDELMYIKRSCQRSIFED